MTTVPLESAVIASLAKNAREEDGKPGELAAIALARRLPGLTFTQFLARVLPDGGLTGELFDRLSDAHTRARAERELDSQLADIPTEVR